MGFKDLFAGRAPDYARFRPTYSPALFAWLAAEAPARDCAVDVGAGSGQASVPLAEHFTRVLALEPSGGQLGNAQPHPRVEYRQAPAEALGLEDACADLLVSGQAFHWFKQEPFFAEVHRVLRPGGLLALWCYGLMAITPALDALVLELYRDRLGPYWESERKLVEEGYSQVHVPFTELPAPPFAMSLRWSFEHLVGYLGTWSSLTRYRELHGTDPLEELFPQLEAAWGGAGEREVAWPLAVRAFRR
jgi:SAM-dependent methyltransferase